MKKLAVAATCAALLLAAACNADALEVGYYKKSCPRVETIVRAEVKKFVYKNAGVGAGLIRLLFHDCFVELIDSFATKGLDAEDMVVLSGAHTVGRSHCSSFVPDRLAVPSDIDGGFASFLRRRCPANPTSSNDPTVNQDVVTPNAFDNQYYKNVLSHKVLFTSDAALLTSPATAKMVSDNAHIPGWWEDRFKKAFVKMAAIDVKNSYQGEIRKNCRVVNY
uniref:peroxidase n=1 Tax=Oryza brachyantha TaxID=4533 RepID=J3LP31_ORYBR